MHKEIGGYLELERFTGPMLHENALALSSGRACLSYLIEQRKIRKIALPDFNCDIVEAVCRAHEVKIRFYPVGADLRPKTLQGRAARDRRTCSKTDRGQRPGVL